MTRQPTSTTHGLPSAEWVPSGPEDLRATRSKLAKSVTPPAWFLSGAPAVGNRYAVNIRKFVLRAARLRDLVELGSLTPGAAAFLEASVQGGRTPWWPAARMRS